MSISPIVLLVITLIAAIPIEPTINWLYTSVINIQTQLEHKQQPCHVSIRPIIEALIIGLKALKGWYIPTILVTLDSSNIELLAILSLLLLFELWPPFQLFKFNPKWHYVLWGLYTFLSPSFCLIYPLGVIILSLLTNSFSIGQLVTILSMFIILSITNANPFYLLANSFFFILVFIASMPKLQHGITSKTLDIKSSYNHR